MAAAVKRATAKLSDLTSFERRHGKRCLDPCRCVNRCRRIHYGHPNSKLAGESKAEGVLLNVSVPNLRCCTVKASVSRAEQAINCFPVGPKLASNCCLGQRLKVPQQTFLRSWPRCDWVYFWVWRGGVCGRLFLDRLFRNGQQGLDAALFTCQIPKKPVADDRP